MKSHGVDVAPVWNKSFREHVLVGTKPADVRREADDAVRNLGWKGPYFVDADHVGMKNVDLFTADSDFFTLDVADFIGKPADDVSISLFAGLHKSRTGEIRIPGIPEGIHVTENRIREIAAKYLHAVQEAGRIFRRVEDQRKGRPFVVEVSMDETPDAQAPVELLFILAAIAGEGIPASTVAPKFTGRFNKGVDYAGDAGRFAREFEQDLAIVAFAAREFGMSPGLKLSVHSGSDKFALYGPVSAALKKFDAGLHLKTAGTTWLEEVIGLAEAGEDGLEIARDIYRQALSRLDELCGPYASVIDIDRQKLPDPGQVDGWDGKRFASALRHDQTRPEYNPHFRQLIHVAYKIAAEMGERYMSALDKHEEVIGRNVTENLYERHLKRVFL
jgi:tagaturonate epimerase